MAWQGIQGHDLIVEGFRRAMHRGRLAGSFLFVGPSGIGKRHFAVALAKGVLCKGKEERYLDPCGGCESCRLFGDLLEAPSFPEPFIPSHPDLYYVCKPPDKTELPMELLIGDRDHRGSTGLCYNISRTPFYGHRKVAIIDDADFFNTEGANALLKTLEEPPTDTVLILIGTTTSKQLPTIRSRCRIIRFAPLPQKLLASLLMQRGVVPTLEQGLALACRSNGGLDQAADLVDDVVEEMRGDLSRFFSAQSPDTVAMAARLNELVEKAGKETSVRRRRLRMLLHLAIDLLRDRMTKQNDADHSEQGAIATPVSTHREDDTRNTAMRLQRTLDALDQIDRNTVLPYIIDAWSNDMRK